MRPGHLDVGHAGRIINRNMDVFPPDALLPRAAIAKMNPMANAANLGEGLDVQMQQVARVWPLVALDDGRRLERASADSSPSGPAKERGRI